MRILLHAQHLSGVGHHVRALAIARTLAERHEVHLVDGGRPVPTTGDPEGLRRLPVPGLRRGAHGLEALEGSEEIASLLRARRLALTQAASDLRPDVVLVEHYPFGKWELEDEILALLEAARGANPATIGVASARDVPRPTRHEALSLEAWAARVRARLEGSFDGLLVHGDPQVTALAEHLPGADALRLPVVATGYVVASPPPEATPPPDLLPPERPYVVVSGGGAGAPELLATAVRARQRHPGAWGGRALLAFTGLEATPASRRALRAAAGEAEVVVSPFRADFPRALRHAELSISCAGYNTCAAALSMGRRVLLVPDPAMSDQAIRAAKLAERGVATALEARGLTPERLAEAIADALAAPPPAPGLAFDRAPRTRWWIERWARSGPRTRDTA